MSRTIDVSLRFNADTKSVTQQLNTLKNSLYELGNTEIKVQGGSIDTAVKSAQTLFDSLQKATDVETGKLDFSKLNESLKKSNTSLREASQQLLNLGPAGQKAYTQLASSIAQSEDSIRRLSKRTQDFINIMVSNISWNLSNSVIDGITSFVQDGIKHIEQLNKSLTDIRIVTGRSTEDMAKFAKEANAAAKALKTTTTEYTNASLIYFQQGLGDAEVQKRTDATVKMAKVTGDSVTEVSNQLTSIWNNFADGSTNLEYYVDVITALGAATASSTDEIATGLEKFSAVADTVGMSYEYATAALATVTSETRQSAEVVGTAFKTLLSRIQDLELGKTLDDGTTIGTYSKALDKVGISIKDQNGELKSMDKILDEMGSKWGTLSKDQQVALAQAVGGVRQYGQLISLMENWDKMQQNVNIAKNSEGTLEGQFESYKDSMEALDDELQNVKESLYQEVFNEEMLKEFKKTLIDIMEFVKRFVDSIGGLKGLLTFGGIFALQALLPKITSGLKNLGKTAKDAFGFTKKEKIEELEEMSNNLHNIAGKPVDSKDSDLGKDKPKGPSSGPSPSSGPVPSTPKPTSPIVPQNNNIGGNDTSVKLTVEEQAMRQNAENASVLVDKRKEYLLIENQLTEAQKEQYQLHLNDLGKREEAVRLANDEWAAAEKALEAEKTKAKIAEMEAARATANKGRELAKKDERIKEDLKDLDDEEQGLKESKDPKSKERLTEIARERKRLKREQEDNSAAMEELAAQSKPETTSVGKFQAEREQAGKEDSNVKAANSILKKEFQSEGQAMETVQFPEASVENMEKIATLQAKYTEDATKANQLSQTFTNLSSKGATSIKNNKKQQEALNKDLTTAKNLIQQYPDAFDDSDKEIKDIQKLIDKVNDGVDLTEEEYKKVEKAIKKVQKVTAELRDETEGMGDAMIEDATARGQGNDAYANSLIAIRDRTLEAAGATNNLENAQRDFNNERDKPPVEADPMGKIVETAQQAAQGLTQVATGIATIGASWNTVFAEGATGAEKFGGVVGALAGVITAVGGALVIVGAIQKAKNAIEKEGIKLQEKDSKVRTKNIGIILTQAIATMVGAEATKGFAAALIALAAGGAIIAAVWGISAANTARANQENEKLAESAAEAAKTSEEQAKTAGDAAEKAKEEYEAIAQLTKEYKNLVEKYRLGLASKQDLINKADEYAKAVDDETALIETQKSEYEAVVALMERKLELQSIEAGKKANEALESKRISYENSLYSTWMSSEKKHGQTGTGLEFNTLDGINANKYFIDLGTKDDGDGDSAFLNSEFFKELEDWEHVVVDGRHGVVYNGDPNRLATSVMEYYNKFMVFKSQNPEFEKGNTPESQSRVQQMLEDEKFKTLLEAEEEQISSGYQHQIQYEMSDAGITNYGKYIEYLKNNGLTDNEDFKNAIKNSEYRDFETIRNFIDSNNLDSNLIKYMESQEFYNLINKYGIGQVLEDLKNSGVIYNTYGESSNAKSQLERYISSTDSAYNREYQNKTNIYNRLLQNLDDISFEDFDIVDFQDTYSEEFDELKIDSKDLEGLESKDDLEAYLYNKLLGLKKESPNTGNINGTMGEEGSEAIDDKKTYIISSGLVGKYNQQVSADKSLDEIQKAAIRMSPGENSLGLLGFENYILDEVFHATEGQKQVFSDIATYAATQGESMTSFLEQYMTEDGNFLSSEFIAATGGEFSEEELSQIFSKNNKLLQLYLSSDYLNEDFETLTGFENLEALAAKVEDFEYYTSKLSGVDREMQDKLSESWESPDIITQEINNLTKQEEESDAERRKLAEGYGITADYIAQYADILKTANEEEEISTTTAKSLATEILLLNKAYQNFTKTMEEYSKVLESGDKTDIDWLTAYEAIIPDLMAISGQDKHFLSKDRVSEMGELGILSDIVEGNISTLREYIGKELIEGISTTIDDEEKKNEFITQANNLISQAALEIDSLEVGASLDQSEFITGLITMLDNAGVTVDQINAILNSMGVEGQITFVEVDEEVTQNVKGTINHNGEEIGKTLGSYTNTTKGRIPMILPAKAGDIKTAELRVGSNSSSIKSSPSGGGGGKKDKKAKDEIERYHEISEEINDLTSDFDRLSKAKDRAFGADKLALMDAEIEKNKELLEAQKRYIKEIEENLKNDLGYALGHGVEIDYESGRIINYDEIIAQKVEEYNSGKIGDEEYEAFMEDMKQYEETLNLLEETQQAFIDKQNEIIDMGLEKVTYQVELNIRVIDNDLALIEYYMEHLEDNVQGAIDSIDLLAGKTEATMSKVESYRQGIYDVFSVKDANGNPMFTDDEISALLNGNTSVLEGKQVTEEQINMIEEYGQALLEMNNSIYEIYETMSSQLSMAFNSVNEDMNKQMEIFSHLQSIAQGYKDVIDLVGKNNLGISNKILQDLNRASLQTSKDALESQRTILETNKEMLKEAEIALQEAREKNDQEGIKMWEEQIEAMNETIREGEEELMTLWNEALTAASEAFASAAQDVMDVFEKSITGLAGGFEELKNQYDQYSEVSKRYLDDYQKIYELNKLNRDIEKQINLYDSIKAKERLRDVQEEINELQFSNNELTQYEINELRAKYDLRLAEIALEETQNAKNQVRMQRDSEGNWAYVYTTNQAQLDQAQQTYEDKLYAYQKLTQEYLTQIESQLISVPQEFAEAVAQINEDLTLTEEERKMKLDEIVQYYTEKYDYLLEEMDKAFEDSEILYEQDWKAYAEKTQYKISEDEKWKDSFTETFAAQKLGFKTTQEAHEKFTAESKKLLDKLETHYREWQKDVDEVMQAAGATMGDFSDKVAQETAEIRSQTEITKTSLMSIANAGAKGFHNLVTSVKKYSDDYANQLQTMINNNTKLEQSLNHVVEAMNLTKYNVRHWQTDKTELVNKVLELFDIYDDSGNGSGSAPPAAPITGPSGKTEQPITITAEEYYSEDQLSKIIQGKKLGGQEDGVSSVYSDGIYSETSWGFASDSWINPQGAVAQGVVSDQDNNRYMVKFQATAEENRGEIFYIPLTNVIDGYIFQSLTTGMEFNENEQEYFKGFKSWYQGYDTGGYTGEWDSSGRIAMLHQKEIVLNAHDTENFLAAVDIVREVARSIDLNAMAQSKGFGYLSAVSATPTSQVVEQEVTIHAEFPNATDRNEIEEAFNNLVNRASQFANRKN